MAKSAKTEEVDSRTNQSVARLPDTVRSHEDYLALRAKMAALPKTPVLVHVDEADTATAPGRTYNWLLTSEQSGGSIALHRMTLEPGFQAQRHNHVAEEEFFYVLEGELEITIGNQTRIAGPGVFAYAPPYATHAFKTHGDKPCVVLHWNSPGGHEKVAEPLRGWREQGGTRSQQRAIFENHEYFFHDETRFADPPSGAS